MKISAEIGVITPDEVRENVVLTLGQSDAGVMEIPHSIAYCPLINSHDHLIGNWVPKAGDKRPYPNSHIWVEDMKNSFSFQERNKYWINDGSFRLHEPPALDLAKLGAYKSLFSGCGIVHDHAPLQTQDYYDAMPIKVPNNYRQCHSITLGNWWGGETPEEEMRQSAGKMPFIIHLGEGTDKITRVEFNELDKWNLLQPNTLMIHGIAFKDYEIMQIAMVKASICWCPTSNFFLIGETLKIDAALRCHANVVIGTDSTMSGATNLIGEFTLIREHFPHIPIRELYRMVTQNAVKALYLPPVYGSLNPKNTQNLLLTDAIESDPFENLLALEPAHIKLLVVDGIPRYGDSEYFELFDVKEGDYSFFRTGNKEKFVIGDPMEINESIDAALGYHKDFPYLPF